jgi:hypothetical protein
MPRRYMGEWRYSFIILNLGIRCTWVVRFTPRPLYPWGKRPGTNWIGGWVGPRVGLGAVEKRKICCPYRKLNPNSLSVQLVTQRYRDWVNPPHLMKTLTVLSMVNMVPVVTGFLKSFQRRLSLLICASSVFILSIIENWKAQAWVVL